MASFFGSIQSLLKDRASGRYLAQVLRTLAVHDPEPVRRFVNECFPGSPVWPKNANVTAFCEEPIVGADAKGRMDLTLAINDSSRVRVEVKYDDQLIEGDEGDQLQIKKQIHACKADGSHLVLLTKNHLRRADADLIGRVQLTC